MNSETFLGWLRYAIGRVGRSYYNYSERVYCYELYHFLRVAMFHEAIDKKYPNLFLHSEIIKGEIDYEIAQNLGIMPLGHRRSPDFLFHDPLTTAHQIAAVEVKARQDIGYGECVEDLSKLSELKERYRFNLGVFHCINISNERILQHINRAIEEGVTIDREIVIISVPMYGQEIEEHTIEQLLS
ncbi:hypothetical protein [Marinomonas gallaica]|uniref:hypothetical protein n=1 Tax=Marinomonas gallaica TaxID=1806667 RepID=UPI000830A5EB|nr:hypothetical protein [Marinomonas gallaica]